MRDAEPRYTRDEVILFTRCSDSFFTHLSRDTSKRKALIRPAYSAKEHGTRRDLWSKEQMLKIAIIWSLRELGIDGTWDKRIVDMDPSAHTLVFSKESGQVHVNVDLIRNMIEGRIQS
jgi:hypothetical protein